MKVLKFYADWCGPCKAATKVIESVEDQLSMPVEAVNIDDEMEMAVKYNVRSVPTFVVVDDNGSALRQEVGFKGAQQFLEFVNL